MRTPSGAMTVPGPEVDGTGVAFRHRHFCASSPSHLPGDPESAFGRCFGTRQSACSGTGCGRAGAARRRQLVGSLVGEDDGMAIFQRRPGRGGQVSESAEATGAGGPYDAAVAPHVDAELDLGSLRLPDIDGVALSFPPGTADAAGTSVVVHAGEAAMQLTVFRLADQPAAVGRGTRPAGWRRCHRRGRVVGAFRACGSHARPELGHRDRRPPMVPACRRHPERRGGCLGRARGQPDGFGAARRGAERPGGGPWHGRRATPTTAATASAGGRGPLARPGLSRSRERRPRPPPGRQRHDRGASARARTHPAVHRGPQPQPVDLGLIGCGAPASSGFLPCRVTAPRVVRVRV